MSSRRHEFLLVNDIRLHAVIEGDGPLVVLLHGWPESWYSWRHQLTAIAQAGYRVVAFDQRGYGQSSKFWNPEAFRIDKLVADVCAVIRFFGEKTAVVVGHDWGGRRRLDSRLAASRTSSRRGRIERAVCRPGSMPAAGQSIWRSTSQTDLWRSCRAWPDVLSGLFWPHGCDRNRIRVRCPRVAPRGNLVVLGRCIITTRHQYGSDRSGRAVARNPSVHTRRKPHA
jgi:pimeloyl-ACP methyl ester carboxylesterase